MNKSKKKFIGTQVDEEMFNQLNYVSTVTGLSKSSIIRSALSAYFSGINLEGKIRLPKKIAPDKVVVGRLVRDFEFRLKVEKLYQELQGKVDASEYRKYKRILDELKRSRMRVTIDNELREKLEFIVARIAELEELQQSRANKSSESVESDIVKQIKKLYEEYSHLSILNIGKKRELKKRILKLVEEAEKRGYSLDDIKKSLK